MDCVTVPLSWIFQGFSKEAKSKKILPGRATGLARLRPHKGEISAAPIVSDQLLKSNRQVTYPHSRGMVDSVGDCWRDADNGEFTYRLAAQH